MGQECVSLCPVNHLSCLYVKFRYNKDMKTALNESLYTVAVVDDEPSILNNIEYALKAEGYKTCTFPNGEDAWNAFQITMPDLIVLDVMMPRMDGLELCRRIREIDPRVPILFLSSRDEEIDRILGLEIGGDDYLCKPFSVRELMVRIKVNFRRFSQDDPDLEILSCGSLDLEIDTCRVKWKGEILPVTVTEFRILEALVRFPGVVKNRQQLMMAAFPEDNFVSDRAADSHIKRLRKKLHDRTGTSQLIETVYGLGYRFCEA